MSFLWCVVVLGDFAAQKSWPFARMDVLSLHTQACSFLFWHVWLTHLGFLFYGKGIINQVILEVIWNGGILPQGKDGLKYSFCSDYDKILNQ